MQRVLNVNAQMKYKCSERIVYYGCTDDHLSALECSVFFGLNNITRIWQDTYFDGVVDDDVVESLAEVSE